MGAAVASRSVASRADGRSSSPPLTIGDVARRSGFSIRALRFYERRGLLPASGRSPGGYRLYSEADLGRLEFIGQAKTLGLTLDQIRELVVAARERSCRMARPLLLRVLDERIMQASRQIQMLRRVRDTLQRRRRALVRRPPTDHGLGYCACFTDGRALIRASEILPKRQRLIAAARAGGSAPSP